MKIALVQINPVIGDFGYNSAQILSWADRARGNGCDLAVFPELALCGYPPQDLLERPAFILEHDRALRKLIAKVSGIGVICGHLEKHTDSSGKALHNSASLIADGKLLFTAQKRLLPTYDVFDEARYFEPGRRSRSCEYKGMRLGVTVCEDIWNDKGSFPQQLYATDPVSDLVSSKTMNSAVTTRMMWLPGLAPSKTAVLTSDMKCSSPVWSLPASASLIL